MNVTKEIDKFIAENGGNVRTALNVALSRLQAANLEIIRLKEHVIYLRNDNDDEIVEEDE